MAEPPQGKRARRRLYVVAGVLVALVFGAFVVERALTGTAQAPGAAPAAPAYSVSVERNGKTLRSFTVAQLHALPEVHIMSDGKPQAGPSVPAVLAAAGVRRPFAALDVRGMGLRDSGHMTLPAVSVNGRLILSFSQRDTVKIVSPTLGFAQRVRDVTAIIVR